MQWLFALTLFVSAALLFVVQPMFAKMVLPSLGGTPSVWNTCMVFYQAALLAGYVYAHLSVKWLGPRRQAAVHLLLLSLPWLVMPVAPAAGWSPPAESNPILWLLMLLAVSVGLPFLFVSASAPMLQAWYAASGRRGASDPYSLYAASNSGSILALLGYPLLVEPHLTLERQAWSWAGGYGLLTLLSLLCAVFLWRSRPATAEPDVQPDEAVPGEPPQTDAGPGNPPEAIPTWARRIRWVALSLAPASLLLGVTTHISTDIASVPLLWVVPLTLYLMTFVLVFARRKLLPHRLMLALQPLLVVIVTGAFFVGGTATSFLAVSFSLHLLTFFVTAMVCHGELAASRPASRYLTEFYLWMSVGGVLGGVLNALVAPLLLDSVHEYPVMIAAACLLRPPPQTPRRRARTTWLDIALLLGVAAGFTAAAVALGRNNYLGSWASSLVNRLTAWRLTGVQVDTEAVAGVAFLGTAAGCVLLVRRRPIRFGLAVFALLIVSYLYSGERLRPVYARRSFFGVLRVRHFTKFHDGQPLYEAHQLTHGSTNHGMQRLDPQTRLEPCTYYHRDGPVGHVFDAIAQLRPLREIGVVGLGTGTVAAYGRPGQRITFYEIDPAVVQIARNPELFTYLADCQAEVQVIVGDARLSLAHGPPRQFDLLLVDAFSSDAIPVHLLTRQAMALYFERLADRGVLAVHISNRHLDLEPVLGNLAAHAGLAARLCDDGDDEKEGKFASTWVVLARHAEDLGRLADDDQWRPLAAAPDSRLWTDDFSNLFEVFRRDVDFNWLCPWTPELPDETTDF